VRRATTSLVAQSRPRLAALAAEGVTTVEIKSGYGPRYDERAAPNWRAARRVAADVGVDVRTYVARGALAFAGRNSPAGADD
jgi:imidazolonepropionase